VAIARGFDRCCAPGKVLPLRLNPERVVSARPMTAPAAPGPDLGGASAAVMVSVLLSSRSHSAPRRNTRRVPAEYRGQGGAPTPKPASRTLLLFPPVAARDPLLCWANFANRSRRGTFDRVSLAYVRTSTVHALKAYTPLPAARPGALSHFCPRPAASVRPGTPPPAGAGLMRHRNEGPVP